MVWKQTLGRFKPSHSDDESVARKYGTIYSSLVRKGNKIPINDVWIAAHALETGAVLATYDPHFLDVPGLRTWDELREPVP